MRLPFTASPAAPNHRRDLFVLFALAVLILGAGFGLRDPWPSDEPRFALVAKLMVDTGQWLIPHRGGEIYPDKPPVLFWLQGALYWLTGNLRIAFLLPSTLSGLLVIGLIYDLTRRLWCHRTGLLAAFVVLISVQFGFQMRNAQIDPLLLAWMTLSLYGLLRHLLLGPSWWWYWAGWFFAGIGAITKGVGPLTLLILLPYALARFTSQSPALNRVSASNWRWWIGPLFLLLAAAIWLGPLLYAVMIDKQPEKIAYLHEILFRQTAKRYVDPWGHIAPWWYLPVNALFSWLPLSLALPWAVRAWIQRGRRLDPRVMLPLGWVILIMIFFSISPAKRDVYILPGLPMMALALAPMLPGLSKKRGFQRLCFGFALGLALILLLAGLLGEFAQVRALHRLIESRDLDPWPMVGAIGLLAAGLILWARPQRGLFAFAGLMLSLWTIYGFWGYPLLNDSRSSRGVMQRAGEMIGPDAQLALVGWREQQLLQADRAVTEFGFLTPVNEQERRGHAWLREGDGKRWVFLQEPNLDQCFDRSLARRVGHANRREWFLVDLAASKDRCDAP
jgi:4-amino-4-deoxy-L-arabinose transferase-like glycosyltransferase